jgi:hypothetical protein
LNVLDDPVKAKAIDVAATTKDPSIQGIDKPVAIGYGNVESAGILEHSIDFPEHYLVIRKVLESVVADNGIYRPIC